MVNSQFIEKLSILEKKNSFNNIKNYWSLNYSRTALYVYSYNNETEFQNSTTNNSSYFVFYASLVILYYFWNSPCFNNT